MIIVTLLFLVGLCSLSKGGDIFVDSALFFARKLHISEIVIGTAILSIGTTLPEISVSALAAAEGSPVISYGNAIGSVICNTGFIAGILCLFAPAIVKRREISISTLFLCISIFICFFSALIVGSINKFVSVILLVLYAISVGLMIRNIRRNDHLQPASSNETDNNTLKQSVDLIVGLIMVIVGSRLLIDNGIRISEAMHVPKQVIAFTFIAFGTSLPEFATAIIAIKKGHAGLSLGNLMGANLLNVTTVLGVSGVIATIQMPFDLIKYDMFFIMLVNGLLAIPILCFKKTFRWQGAALLLLYTYYCYRLFSGGCISTGITCNMVGF